MRALLAREKDEDAPRLMTLLCEAFVAVYTSMLCYSMAACDSHVLYRYFVLSLFLAAFFIYQFYFRLTGLQPTEQMWGNIFGGGTKQQVKVTTSNHSASSQQSTTASMEAAQPPSSPSAAATAMDVAKQRVRLHIKLLQQIGSPASVGGGLVQRN